MAKEIVLDGVKYREVVEHTETNSTINVEDFYLDQFGNDYVRISWRDADGDGFVVASIHKQGLSLINNIPNDAPFKTTNGKIELYRP